MSCNVDLGRLYEENSDPQFQFGMKFVTDLLRPQAGERILDLGCGTGPLTLVLGELVGSSGYVLGVDPDEPRIVVAEEKLKALGNGKKETTEAGATQREPWNENVAFWVGKVQKVIPEGPFDRVFSNLVLHWVPEGDILSTLEGVRKCLKPGGRLSGVLATSIGKIPEQIIEAVMVRLGDSDAKVTLDSAYPYRVISAPFWEVKFREAGFVVEHWQECEEDVISFSNIYETINYIKAYTHGRIDGMVLGEDGIQALLDRLGICAQTSIKQNALYVEFSAVNPVDME